MSNREAGERDEDGDVAMAEVGFDSPFPERKFLIWYFNSLNPLLFGALGAAVAWDFPSPLPKEKESEANQAVPSWDKEDRRSPHKSARLVMLRTGFVVMSCTEDDAL